MRKLKWKEWNNRECSMLVLGAMNLRCTLFQTYNGKPRYLAYVTIDGSRLHREGILQKTMDAGQEEAIQIARDMLRDYHEALKVEMANFGIREEMSDDR